MSNVAEPLNMGELYPLADRPIGEGRTLMNTRAKATGEFRPPRKGEWYLSGAIIGAYQSLGDLETPYWIARLVKARHVQMWVEVND